MEIFFILRGGALLTDCTEHHNNNERVTESASDNDRTSQCTAVHLGGSVQSPTVLLRWGKREDAGSHTHSRVFVAKM